MSLSFLYHQKISSELKSLREIQSRKKSVPVPAVMTSPAAPIWKSLHIVAAAATSAVLTQEREISTCPHRIPGPAPSTTYLLSSPSLSFPLLLLRSSAPTSPHSLTHSFLLVVRPGSSSLTQSVVRSPRRVILSRPNQQVFQEFQMSLELFNTEAPKGDAPQRSRGKGGRRGPASPSRPSREGLDKGKVPSLHSRLL